MAGDLLVAELASPLFGYGHCGTLFKVFGMSVRFNLEGYVSRQ